MKFTVTSNNVENHSSIFFSKTKSETHYLKKIFSLCLQIAP